MAVSVFASGSASEITISLKISFDRPSNTGLGSTCLIVAIADSIMENASVSGNFVVFTDRSHHQHVLQSAPNLPDS